MSSPRRLLVFDSGFLYITSVNSMFGLKAGFKRINYKNNGRINLYDLYNPVCTYGPYMSIFSWENEQGKRRVFTFFSWKDRTSIIMQYLHEFRLNAIR